MDEKQIVEIDLGNGETLTVAPLYVSEEVHAVGGNAVEFRFDVPEGVSDKRVVCVFAELV